MAPLQGPLIGRIVQILSGVMILWLAVFLGLNDRRLGRLITWVVSHNIRGQFNLGYAHYDYWSGLASAILDVPVRVHGGDFEMIDPDGNLVLRVDEISGDIYIGELVRGLLRTAVSAPLKRGSFINLHFSRAAIHGGYARIQPLPSSLRRDPLHPETNIVATMSGRHPGPPGDQPGHLRVIVDGEGASLDGIDFEMRNTLWQLHLRGLAGAATLRFTTDASETRPGRPAFTYEIAPLTARGGELAITPSGKPGQLAPEVPLTPPLQDKIEVAGPLGPPGPTEPVEIPDLSGLEGLPEALADSIIGGPRIALPLSGIELRRFGARPSRMQDLSFRGRVRVSGAPVELDGRLADTYCDVGADLELSFADAGVLFAQLTGGALFGHPRGRARVFGPFSEDLPRLPDGTLHPCLLVAGREAPYGFAPAGSEARLLVIDGAAAQIEADLAQIHVVDGQAPFRLVRNVLTLPSLSASALGGSLRSDNFRLDLNTPMHYSGTLHFTAADPGQALLVPPALRPLLAGQAVGQVHLYGLLGEPRPEALPPSTVDRRSARLELRPETVRPNALEALDAREAREAREALQALHRGELLRMNGVEVDLQRRRRADALPPELKLSGAQITYGPEQMGLQTLHVTGPGMDLQVPGGTVGVESGKLNLPGIKLSGGGQAGRALRAAGVPVSVRDAALSVNLTGRLAHPEIEQGFLQAHGLEQDGGPVIDEVVSGFTVHDGQLALQGLSAKGLAGVVSGRASLQLFQGDVDRRPADPAISVNASADHLDLRLLLALFGAKVPLLGQLSAQVDLGGTLHRPTGSSALEVPLLSLLGGELSDVNLSLDLLPERYDLTSLYTAIGRSGVLRGSADMGRDGTMPLHMTLTPVQVQLNELPAIARLPVQVRGAVSGAVRISGTARPLRPVLEGELNLDGFRLLGQPRQHTPGEALVARSVAGAPRGGAGRLPQAPLTPAAALSIDSGGVTESLSEIDVDPLFKLLGAAVRTLSLGRAQLSFQPLPERGATAVKGRLFDAFDVAGRVVLDAADPHGEITVRFGCSQGQTRAGCDLAVEDHLPELHMLGPLEASARVSGELQLAFGRDAYLATLRLWRALVTVKTADDEGVAQWYSLRNRDAVVLATDGTTFQVQQAWFGSERVVAGRSGGDTTEALGDLRVRGRLAPQDSALDIVGQLRLEPLEELLRPAFQQARGDVKLDLRLAGPRDNLVVSGWADLQGASLRPTDLDTPFLFPTGRLEFQPGQVRVRGLALSVDGARATADGLVTLARTIPPTVERFDLTLRGVLSGQVLQWALPRQLSEARGRLQVQNLHLRGTLADPLLDGVVEAEELRLSLRRFHEVLLHHGTLRFAADKLIFGCGAETSGRSGCQAIEGLVDGDGRLRLAGTALYSGLGGLLRPAWYDALQRVDLLVNLENVRHSENGVYTVEVKTRGPLTLTGSGQGLVLAGRLDVVEGRYQQPFDLKERFLARRVSEDTDPFWKGDELLSRLTLDLQVSTNGLFRVLNNIADLRLSTKDFVIHGPLDSLSMKGSIRADGGFFTVPGLRGEFNVKGDSKIDFDPDARWPETPYVDVRGNNVQFDPSDQQRNVELALRGKVSELKIECLSSDGLNAADCASYLVLGGTTDQIRKTLSSPTYASSPQALAYSDRAIQLLSSQLLTSQIEDPLREKLRLDTVRIQFGVSSFDVQLCKRFGIYMRACGLAEWGLLAATSSRYRAFGQFQFADWAVGEVSVDHLERGFERLIQDPTTRLKLQLGARLPLLY